MGATGPRPIMRLVLLHFYIGMAASTEIESHENEIQ